MKPILAALTALLAVAASAQPADGPPLIPRVMMLWPDLPEFRPVGPEPRPVEPGLFAHDRPVFEAASPDGAWLAGTADGDFYVREAGSDTSALTVPAGDGPRWSVADAEWSPDAARIAVRRVDDAAVPRLPLLDAEGDTARWVPYARVGEPQPEHRLWVVERATGEPAAVPHGRDAVFVHPVGWSDDGARLRWIEAGRFLQWVALREVDVRTGEARTLLREDGDRRVMGIEMIHGYGDRLDHLRPAVFFDGRAQFVWASERTGARHLSLYDADGTLIRPLTDGALPGPVQRVAHVDREAGALYAVASASAERPWDHALYRVGLDGDVRRVVDGPVIEEVRPADGGALLVVRAGLPDLLQVDRVTPDGDVLATEWAADWSFASDVPRRQERLVLTAADGETPLDGLLVLPPDAEGERSVPLVEFVYGGPNTQYVPRTPQTPWLWEAYRVAQAGIAVLFVDGRGSAGRDRAFVDVSYGRLGQVEVADHRAAVEQVLARFPVLDPERVALMGHSMGGFVGFRALAEAPDVYRAAVLVAPVLDATGMRVWAEPYQGCLPADCPEVYAAGSNRALADRVKGAVFVAHGTADDDVPFAEGAGLAAALEAAGADVTFVPMPGWNHILQRSPEFWGRVMGFLGQHLRP
ncbi:S9 family peptidase [Rubrivirga marina]|uniref:Peptidase S9 prolyl oligopeptidase catalytic domain-containing protein n=1 Tax=Rubrivirga marina TaxID=1196024 RepID=A0A271J165_9BACT|nr:alpha/beta fold hydrolase [Rubrivirga marina]PAP77232.1 hypothetical protein BSZ37_12710 [Rubrivirga marina]